MKSIFKNEIYISNEVEAVNTVVSKLNKVAELIKDNKYINDAFTLLCTGELESMYNAMYREALEEDEITNEATHIELRKYKKRIYNRLQALYNIKAEYKLTYQEQDVLKYVDNNKPCKDYIKLINEEHTVYTANKKQDKAVDICNDIIKGYKQLKDMGINIHDVINKHNLTIKASNIINL